MMIDSTLEITTVIGCSNWCRFCPQELLIQKYSRISSKRSMTLVDFAKCMDTVPKSTMIDFSGMAEPWLNPECTEMLQYAGEMGYSLGVYTTGIGMKARDVEAIKKYDFEIFVVHLADDANNARIAVDEDYLAVIDQIAKSIKPAKFMAMGKLHPKLAFLEDKLFQTEMISRAGNVSFIKPAIKKGMLACLSAYGLRHNVLLPNGEVYLCCMDYGLEHRIGNLFIDSYGELFRGGEYRRIESAMASGRDDGVICRRCEYAVAPKTI
jgi:hypothetical protein